MKGLNYRYKECGFSQGGFTAILPSKRIHKKKEEKMAKRKNNQNQSLNGATDTEFGTESTLSKKARKKAARENRKNK